MKIRHLEGLIAAPFTPMKKDGSLNLSVIPEYYRLLKRNKIAGAFINGSTGEGVSQSIGEKKLVAEAWADCTKKDKDFKVITLVGGTCISDCRELAIHASNAGLYGIAMTAPFYFKPADTGQLSLCCIEVGRSVPHLPFYYYHIPVLNGVNFSMYGLLQELDGKLPNFAGIKYTHEDFMDFLSCLHFKGGKYDMLWGRDENMLSALAIGARGAVGSTFNYAAPLYHRIMEAFNRNQLKKAATLQQQSIDMIRLLAKYGGIGTGKAFMKAIGLDCGEFRLPVKNMTAEEYTVFRKDLRSIGFNKYASQ